MLFVIIMEDFPGINLSPKNAKILPVSPNVYSVYNSQDLCNIEGLPPLLIYDPGSTKRFR